METAFFSGLKTGLDFAVSAGFSELGATGFDGVVAVVDLLTTGAGLAGTLATAGLAIFFAVGLAGAFLTTGLAIFFAAGFAGAFLTTGLAVFFGAGLAGAFLTTGLADFFGACFLTTFFAAMELDGMG
jgi:hypothetical protein